MSRTAAIKAIRSFLPQGRLTNEQLAHELGSWEAEKILAKTGIRSRAIAGPDECASDLGVAASQRLFATGACTAEDVDFLLFCTESPDYFLPPTACLVHCRLGLRESCGALDVNQGCSGFVYGLALAAGLIEARAASNVLLVTADTYSKFLNRRDRSVRTIFGDGAAATLVTVAEQDTPALGPFVFGTDGRGAPNLIVPAGGLRQPRTHETAKECEDASGNWRSPQDLYMNGPEVFNFTLRVVPKVVESLLERSAKSLDTVDHFFFHQANRFMLEKIRNKLRIPPEKFWLEMEDCGNTVSSTIPIALESAHQRALIRPGHNLMAVGFGVGYSWAAAMVRWV